MMASFTNHLLYPHGIDGDHCDGTQNYVFMHLIRHAGEADIVIDNDFVHYRLWILEFSRIALYFNDTPTGIVPGSIAIFSQASVVRAC